MPKITVQGIDEQIRKLEELKRFVSDPTTAPLIEQLISQNGNVNAASRVVPKKTESFHGQTTPRGELLDAVEAVCRATGHAEFTCRQVIEQLDAKGYRFQAKNKMVAVNGALKRLVKRNVLKVTEKGTAKKASTYKIPERFPREVIREVKGAVA